MRKNIGVYVDRFFTSTRKWFGSKRFSIYLYCVAIATFIWFLMKFSGSFTTQLPVHVHYTAPSSKWYVMNEDITLNVDVRGFGFSLMWHKISGLNDVVVDLSNFEIKGDELDPFIIIPSDFIISKVSKLFSEDEFIDGIYPSILKVDLSHALNKKVPVVSRVEVYPEKGYKLKNRIQVLPSKVELSGPAYVLANILQVNTKVDTIRGIKESKVIPLTLDFDSLKEWLVSENKVELKINVVELTSGSIEIPVLAKVDDPQTSVKVLPTKVTVFYQVGLVDYQLVNADLFKAYVSLPSTNPLPDKLKVSISDIPDFVEITRIEPPYVEYLISKKQP